MGAHVVRPLAHTALLLRAEVGVVLTTAFMAEFFLASNVWMSREGRADRFLALPRNGVELSDDKTLTINLRW